MDRDRLLQTIMWAAIVTAAILLGSMWMNRLDRHPWQYGLTLLLLGLYYAALSMREGTEYPRLAAFIAGGLTLMAAYSLF